MNKFLLWFLLQFSFVKSMDPIVEDPVLVSVPDYCGPGRTVALGTDKKGLPMTCSSNEACPKDYECKHNLFLGKGYCCSVLNLQCPKKSNPVGPCINGLCPVGYNCYEKGCCSFASFCDSGFLPKIDVGKTTPTSCKKDDDCSDSKCTSGFCCFDPRGHYGGPCLSDDTNPCLDEGTFCDSTMRTCQCGTREYFTENKCSPFPKVGQSCGHVYVCSTPNAQCKCDTANNTQCLCECPTRHKFENDACMRKSLGETCETHAHCTAAYSQCNNDTGLCECLEGFEPDAENDLCKPKKFQCGLPDATPAKSDKGAIITCYKKASPSAAMYSVGTCTDEEFCFEHNCPDGYYCRSYLFSYDQAGAGEGFCCPIPPVQEPVCPVGQRHPSSAAPKYGCIGCPLETHVCFQDNRVSELPACCPKPCANPGDVFIDGACYKHSIHGESCTSDLNCKSAGALYSFGQHMECIGDSAENKVCGCPEHLVHLHGKCTEPSCTSGIFGYPIKEKGSAVKCILHSDCPSEYMCDPTFGVCCPALSAKICMNTAYPMGSFCNASSLTGCGHGAYCASTERSALGVCCPEPVCTIGLHGYPARDKTTNQLIRCATNGTLPDGTQGQECPEDNECDPTGYVCCRGFDSSGICADPMKPTGSLCDLYTGNGCMDTKGKQSGNCNYTPHAPHGVCCAYEEKKDEKEKD